MHQPTTAAGPDDTPSARRRAAVLALLVGATALPVIVALVATGARLGEPTYPHADYAVLELQTAAALDGEQLLGPYSRFGWNHPGPLVFYLLAPAYAAVGSTTHGMTIGALLLNGVAIAGVVTLAWRVAGPAGAALLSALVLTAANLWGPGHLASFWNPFLVVVPLTLLVVSVAAAAAGRVGALAVAVVAASYLLQTHVGVAPTVAAVAGVGVVTWAVPRTRPPAGRPRRPRRTVWIAAAGFAGALVWAPVAVEQARHDPGNVSELIEFAGSDGDGTALGDAALAVASVGVVPDSDVFDGRHDRAGVLLGAYAVQLALLAGAVIVAGRSGRRFVAALGATSLAGHLAALAAATAIRGILYWYLVVWVVGLLPTTWFAIVAGLGPSARRAVPRRAPVRSPRTGRAVGVAAVAVIAALGVLAAVRWDHPPPESATDHPVVAALTPAVVDGLEGARAVRVEIADLEQWPVAAGLMVQLERRGFTVSVEDSWWFMFGHPYARTGDEAATLVVATTPPGTRGGRQQLRVGDTTVDIERH